jgi:hypothetical protein
MARSKKKQDLISVTRIYYVITRKAFDACGKNKYATLKKLRWKENF